MEGEMTQELAIRETTALSVHDLQGRHDRIQQVLKKIMKKGVDYGTIPGCGDKPGLLKSGAEKILSTFELAVRIEAEHITDLSDATKVRYRIISPIVHIHTGLVVGHGVGECSSEEEKYAWKSAVCNEEWEATDPNDRREKWKRGRQGQKNYTIKQIRTNPADVANTVLKMSKKRSVVDGTLTATGASDMFEQGEDVTGDEDEGFNREGVEQPKEQKPQSSGPLMPGYAGKYANKPVADMTLETLKEFYPGILKSIADPSKATWKDRNQKVADAMKARIDELEAASPKESISAVELTSMMGACQSMNELSDLMNGFLGNRLDYTLKEQGEITAEFEAKKDELTPKKAKP